MFVSEIIAHGIGSRTSLPLPFWQLSWASIAALGVSFGALGLLWKKPIFNTSVVSPSDAARKASDEAPATGNVFDAGSQPQSGMSTALRGMLFVGRLLSFALFLVCIVAGLFGEDQPLENITPVTIYVVVWVGVPFLSVFLGDIWRIISPFETINWFFEKVRSSDSTVQLREAPNHHWFAIATILGFLFLELAHPSGSSPRVLGWAMLVYTAITTVGIALWGRGWLKTGEGFGVLYGLIGAAGPIFWDRKGGRLRTRLPLAGLSTVSVRPGTVLLILVALGGTSFDGFSESDDFLELVGPQTGWAGVSPTIVGLLVMIGLAWGLYLLGSFFTARIIERGVSESADVFAPSLIPIVWGYLLAHYALLLVDELQRFWFLLSNPLGTSDAFGNPSMDLFGAAEGTINFDLLSADALDVIAWVQTSAIVVGHIAGVAFAHDIGVAKFNRIQALRSQYVMLFVMMIYSIGGLGLLFNS